MKPKCNLMVALSVALSVFAVQANVRQWTGAGDGVNFADSRNWDGEVLARGDHHCIAVRGSEIHLARQRHDCRHRASGGMLHKRVGDGGQRFAFAGNLHRTGRHC